MFTLVSSIAASVLAQTADNAGSPSAMGFGVLAAVFALATVALVSRTKKLDEQLAQVTNTLSESKDSVKTLTSREKKLEKDLADKTSQVGQLKKDMGAQRKKTHAAQEEVKTLRNNHKTELEKVKKNIGATPAFQEAAQKAALTTVAEVKPEVEAAPVPTAEELTQEQLDNIKQLEDRKNHLETKLTENKKYVAKVKAEVKESRFRVERYRRVDIMTKNKTGVLEDKLLTLGRQYYDAISEIALLKGDVKPSRPRTLVEAETRAVEREQEQEVLEKEAAAAAIEKAEEAEKAPVQLDASLFEENEEESAEAPEATPETAPSAQDVVEPSAMETTTETLEAAPASV
jgi:chromosome segregation ATPase